MPKNRKTALPLAVTVAAALLAAMSIILGKYLAIRAGDTLRFSFENLPILLAGMAFGPVVGTVVGVTADLIGCLMVGYVINPLVTLGAAVCGCVGGLLFRLTAKMPLGWRVSLSVFSAHLLGSVVIKTIGLASFFTLPFTELLLWRTLNYLLIGALETVLLYSVMKSRAVQAQLDTIRRR